MTISAPQTPAINGDEVQYVNANPRKHSQRSSIQHWQLRDLLTCPEKHNEIYYIHQNNVNMYNTDSKQAVPVMKELTFSPTSMASACGYLAAGGQRSQLMVRQLHTNWFAQTTVGGSINNSLCISRHPRTTDNLNAGDVRLLVCNNDETIKIYSLPSLQRITTIGLPTAVNFASVSPDGRRLCAVGDSNQVFLFDISASGYYQRIATLNGTNDAGFSCSWNHSSEKIAVGSQDGMVSVWDIRYISNSNLPPTPTSPMNRVFSQSAAANQHLQKDPTKLACIPTTQHALVKGACRSVKFSPSPSIDLLMFTEHVNYVNFVDARTFDSKQSIRVSPAGVDMHLSGSAWTPDCRSVYLGMESSIMEFDVDTVSRRCFPRGTLI